MSTKKCSKCKMEIDSKATKCPYCGSSQGMSCSGMLGALVFIVVIIGVLGAIGNSRNSDKPNTSSTSQSEEDNINWANKSLGLYWASEKTTSQIDTFDLIHIYGAIGNASKKDYEYVTISYSIYDESGAKIGDATDFTAGLKSGEIWKFEAMGSGKGAKSYKIDSIGAR